MEVFRTWKTEFCCSVKHWMITVYLVLFTFSLSVVGKYDVMEAGRRAAASWTVGAGVVRPLLPCSHSDETLTGVVRREFPSKANQTVRSNKSKKYDHSDDSPCEEEDVAMTTSGGKDAGRHVNGGGESGFKVPKTTSGSSSSYRPAPTEVIAEKRKKRTPSTTSKQLHIGALFELSDEGGNSSTGGGAGGQSDLAAAKMAIRDINDKQFVPGYHLELIYNDTKVSPLELG